LAEKKRLDKENKWLDKVYRTTKCFGVNGKSKIKGAFPKGFIEWIQVKGWYRTKRLYLCSGLVDDPRATKVDIRPDLKPTLVEDATKTSLLSNSFDWIMIDPPYTKLLAKEYYGTEDYYHGINAFTREAERICRPKGIILTLSYEIPKRIKNCDFIAVCGVYTMPFTGYMRCFTVSEKRGDFDAEEK